MNLLCIARRKSKGGAELVQQVFLNLASKNHHLEVIYLDDYRGNNAFTSVLHKIRAVFDIINQGKGKDAIFGMQDTTPIYLATLSGKLNSTKSIGWIHNTWSLRKKDLSRLHSIIAPFIYNFTNHMIAVSDGVKIDLINEMGFLENRITTAYNPFNFRQINEMIMNGPEIEIGRFIISVGRLERVKGFDLLIQAFSQISDKNINLVIVGTGSQEQKLKSLAQHLGIQDRVIFTGFKENPYVYYKNAQLFVMSSRYEGFGRVIVEALYCGVPSIVADCPSGPREIVADGKYAKLVPSENIDALKEAINNHILNPKDLITKAASFNGSIGRFEENAVVSRMLEFMQ